jgi:predicted metal-dependent phosphoesterase TrpH
MNMNLIKADIHIHTCLSPCAELTQSPKRVIEKAYKSGLNMIFITDHNTAQNTENAIKAGRKFSDLRIYPGMEITSREEVHTLALFESLEDAVKTQDHIHRFLPDTINKKEYEEQVIANEDDEVEGYSKKSLFSSVNMNIENIIDLIHNFNGLAIAAHIDRPSFSVISQLGFIPENLKYDGLEISPNMTVKEAGEKYKEYGKYKFVTGSDSHSLDEIGVSYTEYEGKNDFKDFVKYLRGTDPTSSLPGLKKSGVQ